MNLFSFDFNLFLFTLVMLMLKSNLEYVNARLLDTFLHHPLFFLLLFLKVLFVDVSFIVHTPPYFGAPPNVFSPFLFPRFFPWALVNVHILHTKQVLVSQSFQRGIFFLQDWIIFVFLTKRKEQERFFFSQQRIACYIKKYINTPYD